MNTSLGWTPLIPCCPHCRTTTVPRAPRGRGASPDVRNDGFLCLDCIESAGIVRRAEPVPSILHDDSWRSFNADPIRWLMGHLGRRSVLAIPTKFRGREAHRLLHCVSAQFWGDEDVRVTYDALAEPLDVWSLEAHSTVTGIDSDGSDYSDAPDVQQEDVRHAFHVRIWRSRFNKSVAEPLIALLQQAGIFMATTSVARGAAEVGASPQHNKRRCVPTLVVDQLGDPPSKTSWSMVLDVPDEQVSVILRGEGHHDPRTMTVIYAGGERVAVDAAPFDMYTLVVLLLNLCNDGD